MKKYLLLLLLPMLSFAFEIQVSGNTKTSIDVINAEILDLRKELVDKPLVKEIERRLWNLRIFSKVNVESVNAKNIKIKVEERWTTIPIAKFGGGGGSSFYVLGAYDINSFGKNTELGAQYESLNNRPAGVVWLRKPQFLFDRNLSVGIDIWTINRVRYLYTRDAEDNGAFTLQRKRYNTFFEYKWDNDFYKVGFQYDYQQDEISDFGLDDEFKVINSNNGFVPDSANINRFHTIYLNIGRLNYQNYLLDGMQLSLKSSLVITSQNDDEVLSDHELKFQYFKLLPNHHNFAWNFVVTGNNLKDQQNLKFLGGLSEVRGYLDGQFYANTAWQNNLEHRFDIFERKWGVIQAVVFTDQAKEGKTFEDITKSKDEILLSSGMGIRIISPKIYRFVGRIDYAQTHTRNVERGISFGIQQFF